MPAYINRHGHGHAHAQAHARMVEDRDFKDMWDQWTSQVAQGWDDVFGKAEETTTSTKAIKTTAQTHETQAVGDPVQVTKTSTKALPTTVIIVTTTSETQAQETSSSTDDDNETVLITATSSPSITPTTKAAAIQQTTSLPPLVEPSVSENIGTTLAVAASTSLSTLAAIAAPSTTPTTSAVPEASSDNGAASKAGIAIGVLAGLLLVGMAIYFFYNKKRKEAQRLQDDEKLNGPFSDAAAIPPPSRSEPKAPQLSLRPVTQFSPNLAPQGQYPDRRASRGAALAINTNTDVARGPASPWERTPVSAASTSHNPFTDAQRIPEEPPLPPMPVSPIESEHEVGVATTTDSPPHDSPLNKALPAVGAGIAGAAVGAAGAGLVRKASIRKDAPKALDLTKPPGFALATVPPSPAGTEYSMDYVQPGQSPGPSTSAAAIAAAGGPSQSTVHRVQLDFSPTLEDEMGLQAGQLVRLLHEYDDGWALCIRLDRSEQGVVPRTCLSTRPVKPRQAPGAPRGPPVNPQRARGPSYSSGQRPMTPQGPGPYPRPDSARRPSASQGPVYRPQSPAGPMGRPMSPGPRSMSPAMRSQSPGPRPQTQDRPQSPSQARRMTPPHGPSGMSQEYRPGPPTGPVGRKPVPGQAY